MKGSFANKFFIRNFCEIFEANIFIYESLPKIDFDKTILCQMENDIW